MMFSPSSCGWLDQQANVFLFSSSRFSSKLEDDDERRKTRRLVFLLFKVLVVLGVATTTEMMRFGDVLARIAFASLL
jgi:hypothetical protein